MNEVVAIFVSFVTEGQPFVARVTYGFKDNQYSSIS
jgi:nitroimidazol reductase NimA-like FMN-containing flavoprotein (pyridoxamine 5'-phosphate oxidase superfamily)